MANDDERAARLRQVQEAARTGNLVIGNAAVAQPGSVVATSHRRHNGELLPEGEQGALVLQWSRVGKGFGELTITTRGGKLVLDTECMSRETVRGIVLQALDEAIIVG